MSIISRTVYVKAWGSTIKWLKENDYSYVVSTMVEVNIDDIPSKSMVKILRLCDDCGDEKWVTRNSIVKPLGGEHRCVSCEAKTRVGANHHQYTGEYYHECMEDECTNKVTRKEYDRCRECSNMYRGKENHYKWIEDRSTLTKRSGSQMEKWGNAVKLRDGNKCVLCKADDKPLEAHHLVAFSTDKNKGYNVENGVCLCNECHRKFHIEYGYGSNTAEQFEEFAGGAK